MSCGSMLMEARCGIVGAQYNSEYVFFGGSRNVYGKGYSVIGSRVRHAR